MGKLRWYKRDPVAALEGMSNLTLEEVGAYNVVLDLIYARDGKVNDDPRFISGWLRCDIRIWKRIRASLIAKEKLYVDEGTLRNHRADDEVHKGLLRVLSVQQLSRSKGLKSGAVRRKNKDLGEPSSNRKRTQPQPQPQSKKLHAAKAAQEAIEKEEIEEKPEPVNEPPKAKLFRKGKTILISLGVAEKRSGSLLGLWLKQKHDPEGILAALQYAAEHGVIEPIGYVTRLLAKESSHGKIKSTADRAFELADEWERIAKANGRSS